MFFRDSTRERKVKSEDRSPEIFIVFECLESLLEAYTQTTRTDICVVCVRDDMFSCFNHSYRRYRLLTYMALLQTRVNNGDSKWWLNRAKGQATMMEKAILGSYFWKLMLRINRNR